MSNLLETASDRGRIHRALLAAPCSSVETLAARTGLSEAATQAALEQLAIEELVLMVDPAARTWEALPPLQAVEAMLQRDALRHADLRRAGAELEQLYRFARRDAGHYGALEVIEGSTSILRSVQRLQRSARRQVRVIDVPPYAGSSDYYFDQEVLQRERMAAGVVYRTIYYGAAFDDPVVGPNMARMIEAGEQARALDEPPMKLLLGDDDLALMTLDADDWADARTDEHTEGIALLIRPSGLFRALAKTFESFWTLAVPVSGAGLDTRLDSRDRQILTLMASGATDDAIARRLGLGRRTIVRRVAALQAALGATTRFQAGVQAGRRGWL